MVLPDAAYFPRWAFMPICRGYLLVLFLAGCVSTEPSRSGVSWQSFKANDTGPDRVLFDIALVQRPINDSFLNTELWASADEMILPVDLRENLELNGFRIGLLVGSPPEKLGQLLQSDRSCIDRRGRSVPSGVLLAQNLRESPETVEALLHRDKVQETVSFERPLFGLDLLPNLKQQTVRLRMTPRIEAGVKSMNFKPVPEESKWALELKRPTKLLTDLAMEINLAPNQILIIGGRPEREGSVGYLTFVDDQSGETYQRLLIIRHLRSAAPAPESDSSDIPYPALASQAAKSSP